MNVRVLCCACAALYTLTSCSGESGVGAVPEEPAPDAQETLDTVVPPDLGTDTVDAATDSPDGSSEDVAKDPLANVYPSNPVDTPQTIEAPLAGLADPKHLIGSFASVRGCTADLEAGKKSQQNIGIPVELTTCTPKHRATRGGDGSYLHITPPPDPSVSDDEFAEVMMYHHMQRIHGYYKDTFGLSELDHPLDAVVNVQIHLAAPGLCEEWVSIANAAFIPPGAAAFLPFPLDVEDDAGHIIFSQSGDRDFAYDADVIYHEYTHAMIGATRLTGVFIDAQGLNNQPGALNEAYADYFAATLMDDSVIGNYALADLQPPVVCGFPLGFGGQNFSRDLSTARVCPDDLTGEVHADGEVFGSALWAIREALGAEKADSVIMAALVTFGNAVDFNVAAQGTIYRANKELEPADAAVVSDVFNARGLGNCVRIVSADKIGARGVPLMMETANQQSPFGGTPGYLQIKIDVPASATTLTVTANTVSQGLFGSGDKTFQALFKAGSQFVFFNQLAGEHDAVVAKPFVHKGGGNYEATVSGSCLKAGTVSMALLNTGAAFSIEGITVATSTGPPTGADFECD